MEPPYAEGDHRPGPTHHEDQDHRSPREEILRLDRWLHPCLPVHLPADVDLQAGVRRVRPIHRAQEVLLNIHSNLQTFKTMYEYILYFVLIFFTPMKSSFLYLRITSVFNVSALESQALFLMTFYPLESNALMAPTPLRSLQISH